jgi:uncharacterized membrane protein YphA (DoxX/SURF4 family)
VAAVAVVFYLPFLEIVCGMSLILGKAVRAAAAVAGVLMLIFIIAAIQATVRGLDIRCGCFGSTGLVESYTWLLVRDGLIGVLACLVWRRG